MCYVVFVEYARIILITFSRETIEMIENDVSYAQLGIVYDPLVYLTCPFCTKIQSHVQFAS